MFPTIFMGAPEPEIVWPVWDATVPIYVGVSTDPTPIYGFVSVSAAASGIGGAPFGSLVSNELVNEDAIIQVDFGPDGLGSGYFRVIITTGPEHPSGFGNTPATDGFLAFGLVDSELTEYVFFRWQADVPNGVISAYAGYSVRTWTWEIPLALLPVTPAGSYDFQYDLF